MKEKQMLQVMGDNGGSNLIEQLKNLKNGVSYARVIIFSILLLTSAFVFFYWNEVSVTGASFINTILPSPRSGMSPEKINSNFTTSPAPDKVTNKTFGSPPDKVTNKTFGSPPDKVTNKTFGSPPDKVTNKTFGSPPEECQGYFKWIHEDLRPWKDTGITKKMVESAHKLAYIRIVVVKGRVYLKKFKWVFQTRDVFNIWGILQLLRMYPGKLPDLDIMFECGDMPVIKKRAYKGSRAANIPPMFHYCGSDSTFDITFPDWSFWGWPELQVKPWETLEKELEEGNYKVKWEDRVPYAYWKGNTRTGRVRKDLLKCNVSKKQDWGALIYHVDWQHEKKMKFEHTDLASQCIHRYKIYAEGNSWSVSEKYILACDSMSLLITPHYYDFFTRSLIPTIHYWPVSEKDKCRSIKYAVNWGNSHAQEAQKIGRAGSKFIQEELKMKHVYDYMFHLLYRYGKLLKYQPTVPEGAVEMSIESMLGGAKGLEKTFMVNSMVKGPSDLSPCNMPEPYDSAALQAFMKRKENLTKQVERSVKKDRNL